MKCDDIGSVLNRYGEAASYLGLWGERSKLTRFPQSLTPTITVSGGFVYEAGDLHMGIVIVEDHFAHFRIERNKPTISDRFSRFEDAAKLLVKDEGEQIRSRLNLPLKYFEWKALGVHPAVEVTDDRYRARLSLRDDPSVWCSVPAFAQAATSQIMMMSMAELDAQLIEGMDL
ncbi:hypothetical protein FCG67_07575 [Rhodococcus oryzae]|uniref:Uncharacterized protein n=1 Tax=Rhodococcus oryzae TaxID=2571143 RepID=A0ABY2RMV3_9NOCA|nr:hypothetical protein [Rhodococcus oryzae]TJZ79481.1 hypothetical protein FCG67_07575 [Rhodococcus oryzae]